MSKNNNVAMIPNVAISIDPLHNTVTYNRDYINKKSMRNPGATINTSAVDADNVVSLNEKLNNVALNDTHRDILDSVVTSCREDIENGFIKLMASNKEEIVTPAKKNTKYVTKAKIMEVWDHYLDDITVSEIAENTNLAPDVVNRIIVNQYRPVHPKYIGKKYSDQDIVNYNYIRCVYAEVIRRCKIRLYHRTRALSEKRHFEDGLPWSEAIITPLEYISTDKVLTAVFKEIAAEYRKAISTQKVKPIK